MQKNNIFSHMNLPHPHRLMRVQKRKTDAFIAVSIEYMLE